MSGKASKSVVGQQYAMLIVAMVAAAGWYRLKSDGPSPLDTGADPNLRLVSTLS